MLANIAFRLNKVKSGSSHSGEEIAELQPTEIKLLTILRVILSGGWVIDELTLNEILNNIEIWPLYRDYQRWVDQLRAGNLHIKFDIKTLTVLQTTCEMCLSFGFTDKINLEERHMSKKPGSNLASNRMSSQGSRVG